MYVVLPALYLLALKKRAIVYLFAPLALFCTLGFVIAQVSGGHLNMAAYVLCFPSGVLCYSLRNRIHAFIPSVFWPPFVLLLLSCYCLLNLHGDPNYWIGWIFCFFLGLGINTFHDPTQQAAQLRSRKAALYSSGLYLLSTSCSCG